MPTTPATAEDYAALGLRLGATDAQIKKSFRKLSKQYHPDRNIGNEEAERKYKEVVAAYARLCGKATEEDPIEKKAWECIHLALAETINTLVQQQQDATQLDLTAWIKHFIDKQLKELYQNLAITDSIVRVLLIAQGRFRGQAAEGIDGMNKALRDECGKKRLAMQAQIKCLERAQEMLKDCTYAGVEPYGWFRKRGQQAQVYVTFRSQAP